MEPAKKDNQGDNILYCNVMREYKASSQNNVLLSFSIYTDT